MNKPYNDKGWASHIKELKKFKEKFGHCNVRRTQKEYITLSYWIRRVRGLYKLRKAGKHTTLTDERIQELEDLGFGWEGWSANRSDVFQTRLKELQEFRQLHGHCRLPSPHPENPSLKSWANSIRQKFRQQNAGGKATLTEWQIDQLRSVGFEFETAADGRGSWKKHMQILKEFKEANGHCQVPLDHPGIGQWASSIQEEFQNIMEHGDEGSTFLTRSRIAELEAVGLISRRDGDSSNLSSMEESVASSSSSSCDKPQSLKQEDEDEPQQDHPHEALSVLPSQHGSNVTSGNPFSSLASLAEICRVVCEEEERNALKEHPPTATTAKPRQQVQEDKSESSKKAPPGASRKRKSKEGYGHWTHAEHEAFLLGLKLYGRRWTKIASKIPSRSTSQVRSHAQKFFEKMKRDEQDHPFALLPKMR